MKRRAFLKTAALTTAGVASLSPSLFAQDKKKIPIAVQVYCVRKAAEKDLPGALKKIAGFGYDGVEFAGYYGNDPKEIREMLDDCGLKCSGTHTGLGEFSDEKFDRTVQTHKTLGTRFMIIPWLDPKLLTTVDGNKKMADQLNRISEKAKAVDMVLGYHAHGGDAKLCDGIPAWERLFDALSPDVLHQMDIGNYMAGSGDPYKMIEKFKGRTKSVHLKDTGSGPIGSGKVDWKRTFELCETIGGTEWYVVEDEEKPDSFDRIEVSLKALRDMGK